jgi:hypothetical protein
MGPNIWELFLSKFALSEEASDSDDDEESGSRFVPSPMDLSVRIAHGGSDADLQREINTINQQAKQIEESNDKEQRR